MEKKNGKDEFSSTLEKGYVILKAGNYWGGGKLPSAYVCDPTNMIIMAHVHFSFPCQ